MTVNPNQPNWTEFNGYICNKDNRFYTIKAYDAIDVLLKVKHNDLRIIGGIIHIRLHCHVQILRSSKNRSRIVETPH
jgi:hypothetical protein